VASLVAGAADFSALAKRLKDAGETGLRRELYKAVSKAAKPLGDQVRSEEYLKPYMPDRYAGVLSRDMSVRTFKGSRSGGARVAIFVKGRDHDRQVTVLERGFIRHPIFADAGVDRRDWRWWTQAKAMTPGFFSDAVKNAGPQIRRDVLAAMHDVAQQIERG
jgi:hypothetical protein